ncbi:a-factor receptor [Serendipita sp. 399]|nr:a-factor receptor [Serendipita sp. 399]
MALSSLELLLVLPLNLVSFISNLRNIPMRPWVSWSYVHYNFSRVAYVSRFMMQRAPGGGKRYFVEFALARWAIPITGFLFFVFFGWSVEAKREYRSWWEGIKKAGRWCLFRRPAAAPAGAVDGSDWNRKSGGSSSFASPMVDTTTTATTNSIRTLSMQTPTTSSHLLDLNEGRKREKKRGGRGRGGWRADPLASITSTDLEDLVADVRSTTINDDDDGDVDLDLERNLVAEEVGEEVGVLALPPLSVLDAVYNPHSAVWSPSPLPFISSPTSSSSSSSCESPTTTTAVGTVGKQSGGGGMFGGWDSNKPLPPTPLPSRPVSLATLVSVRSGRRKGTRSRTPPPPVPSGAAPTIVTVPATPTDQERRAEDEDEDEETETETGMETVYHTPAPSNIFLRPLSIASTSLNASVGHLWNQQQQPQQRDGDRDGNGIHPHPHPRIATPIPPLLSLPLPAPIPGAPSTGGGGGGRSKGKGKGKVHMCPASNSNSNTNTRRYY